MKKFLLPLLGCAVWLGGCSKGDAGDKGLKRVADVTTKMDDPKFIEYCLNYFDTDNNGKLSMQEAEQVTRIDFTDMGLNLTSLAGIEYFSNLEWLDCENNSLTELDLSYNTTLNQLYCSKNQLTSLILPQKTPWGAKGNILSTIHCSQNRLTELDASNSFELQRLSCWKNQLVSINVSDSRMLQELDCYNNKLAGKLDLRHCHEIAMLDCSYNEDLTELWLYEHCLTSDLIKDEQTAVIRHDDNNIPVKIGIPDRYFKDFLLSICDANNNGVISSEEAATITEIDLNDIAVPCYITSMEGIEHFANLEKFWDSGDYHIDANSECTVLDFSRNTALKYLDLRSFQGLKKLCLIEGHTYETLELPENSSEMELEVIYK